MWSWHQTDVQTSVCMWRWSLFSFCFHFSCSAAGTALKTLFGHKSWQRLKILNHKNTRNSAAQWSFLFCLNITCILSVALVLCRAPWLGVCVCLESFRSHWQGFAPCCPPALVQAQSFCHRVTLSPDRTLRVESWIFHSPVAIVSSKCQVAHIVCSTSTLKLKVQSQNGYRCWRKSPELLGCGPCSGGLFRNKSVQPCFDNFNLRCTQDPVARERHRSKQEAEKETPERRVSVETRAVWIWRYDTTSQYSDNHTIYWIVQ